MIKFLRTIQPKINFCINFLSKFSYSLVKRMENLFINHNKAENLFFSPRSFFQQTCVRSGRANKNEGFPKKMWHLKVFHLSENNEQISTTRLFMCFIPFYFASLLNSWKVYFSTIKTLMFNWKSLCFHICKKTEVILKTKRKLI